MIHPNKLIRNFPVYHIHFILCQHPFIDSVYNPVAMAIQFFLRAEKLVYDLDLLDKVSSNIPNQIIGIRFHVVRLHPVREPKRQVHIELWEVQSHRSVFNVV